MFVPKYLIPILGWLPSIRLMEMHRMNQGTAIMERVNGATLCKDRKGKDDSAYTLDGVDDFIRIANSDFMNPSSISISCWYAGTKSFEGCGTNVLVQKPYTFPQATYLPMATRDRWRQVPKL